MKHLKKLGSVLLALVMVLALAVPAFADTAEVSVSTEATGHTFTAFPIFTADATENEDGLKLNTINWYNTVNGVKVYHVLTSLDKDMFPAEVDGKITVPAPTDENPNATEQVAITDAKGVQRIADLIIEKWGDESNRFDNTRIKEFADALVAADKADNGTILGTGLQITTTETQELPTGYCLIVDEVGDTSTNMLWTIYGDTTVTPKKGDTKVEKTVWDPEITFDENNKNGWLTGAVYSDKEAGANVDENGNVIDFEGDKVIKFKIKVDIPDNIATYGVGENGGYNIVLKDKQDDGLAFVSIDSINLYSNDGTELRQDIMGTNNRANINTEPDDGNTFVITIDNVQTLSNIRPRDYIEIIYSAKFNKDTVTGADGNTNEVTLTVDGEDYTDKAKVFRLELDINKTDNNNKPLKGVEFRIESLGDDDTPDGVYTMTGTTDENGKLVFVGMPAGKYKLTETKPLANYNEIDPMIVTITADATADDDSKLVVSVDNDQFKVAGGNVTTDIVNRQGSLLPETGGIGTTIFYIVGGLLVVGAVVLLITKRRTSADEE